jgi:hypothetical protein
MQFGASAASRHFNIGYSIVRRRVRAADVKLHRGRRRDKTLAARNAEIRILRMQGLFLIDIGKRFNLGRERIRQILAATGGDPWLQYDQIAQNRLDDTRPNTAGPTMLAPSASTHAVRPPQESPEISA